MRRIVILCAIALVAVGVATEFATPNPNSVVFSPRVFNDCPTSVLTYGATYPSDIYIEDMPNCASGFANLHVWRFSEDGSNPAVFNNADAFSVAADLVLSGTSGGESGLQISPWWSQQVDGRFNGRIPDGEIACFGGRLPFYSFTATYGIHYVAGTPIHLAMIYLPHDLNQANPATIEYQVTYQNQNYTSGPLAFDEGNPAENHGTWGILDDARVGAHLQDLVAAENADCRAEWTNVVFVNLTPPPITGACCLPGGCTVITQADCLAQNGTYMGDGSACDPDPCGTPVEKTTWGSLKHRYH